MTGDGRRGVAGEATIERLLDVLQCQPSALFTDIDGTISAIAATPAEAFVSERAKDALNHLADCLALVGLVTGRAAADGAAMVGPGRFVVVGNHGMEFLSGDEQWFHPGAVESRETLTSALATVEMEVARAGLDGVVIENKRLSGSIHYRLALDPVAARESLLAIVSNAASAGGLVVTEGRFVIELRPNVLVNKGVAIASLVDRHQLRGVAFFGDDVTDVDGFATMRTLRETGAVRTVSIGVLSAETHPTVIATADETVDGVAGCIDLLEAAAAALRRTARCTSAEPGDGDEAGSETR